MSDSKIARSRQFVSFKMKGGLFGFDIRLVKEVTPAIHITPVPRKVHDVSGVVNLRGQVVVVLDISLSLGGEALTVSEDSQIIIIKTARELEAVPDFIPNIPADSIGIFPVGFLVDSVGDIITVESEQVETAPTHLVSEYRTFVEGVVHQDPLPLVILNAGAILAETA